MYHNTEFQCVSKALCNINGIRVFYDGRNVESVVSKATNLRAELTAREGICVAVEVCAHDEQAHHVAHRRAVHKKLLQVLYFCLQELVFRGRLVRVTV